jgi:hypothetical protein
MVWSGMVKLPSETDMMREVLDEVRRKEAAGVPQKYFHVQVCSYSRLKI